MKAYLVSVTFTTRVLVPDNSSEMEPVDRAIPRLSQSFDWTTYENYTVEEDTECPYVDGEENEE